MSYEEEIAWGVQQMLDADLQFPQDVPVRKIVTTNADHIRSMTDEELADFIDSVYCHGWSKGANGFLDDDPYYHDWLKQPYGGDA